MIKVVSNENMRMSDAYTIKTTTSSKELMYKAGYEIFKNVEWISPIAIVCGSGNNAGDGYVLAKLLHDANYECTIFLTSDKFSEDGLYYFNKCKKENIKVQKINKETTFSNFNMIVDCILGTGFKGQLNEELNSVVRLINNSNKTVISVDINSGLNGDSGLAINCVHSALTISIGYYKSGHFLNQAKDVMKEKINREIGIKLVNEPYYLLEAKDLKEIFSKRKNYSNKSTYAYVALIGGSINYSGAIRLASMANACMRSGAGVVSVAVPKSLVQFVIPASLESTIMPMEEVDGHIKFNKELIDDIIKKYKVIAFGMGITNAYDTKEIIKYILENYEHTLLIDADGLNALSILDDYYLKNKKCNVVLTPHMMEFSRLTKLSIEEINVNPIKYAKEYASKYKVTLLLKGPSTIITDGNNVYIVDRGCPGMATAGSGDVLSGIISGILGYNHQNILLAVAAGAYVNGLAGELAQEEYGDISMIASDTVNHIYKAIKQIKDLDDE